MRNGGGDEQMQRLEAEAQCERVWCKGEVEAEAKATSNSEGGV